MIVKSKVAVLSIFLVLIVGWVAGLGCYPLVMWSPLNCRHDDIDIDTGQIRQQRYLLGLCVRERIEDSPVSRELQLAGIAPDWRRANTFSPLVRHSPHYAFHSAIHQTRLLELVWQTAPFTPAARKRTSQDVLRLWQTGQRDGAADGYIDALSALAMDRDTSAPPVFVEDLPGA